MLYIVTDANLQTKFRLVPMVLQIAAITLWERPDIVISTGAAPGYLAMRLGKLVGAKTIWVDSMANAERWKSLSGKRAGACSILWVDPNGRIFGDARGPYYEGAVL